MASSLNLHQELLALTKNVYFQPPESIKLSFPCIIYKRSTGDTKFANNGKYLYKRGYEVTVIDTDPDRILSEEVYKHFQYCKHNQGFVSDNLYHDSLTIYY